MVAVVLSPEERHRVERLGRELSIPRPLEGDRLRFERGVCVFLDAGGRCAIHARHGLEAKPWACRQFPVILVRTGSGELRMGLDPACHQAWRTWRDGPELAPDRAAVRSRPLPAAARAQERRLLEDLHRQDLTVARFLSRLVGAPPRESRNLPPGLASRILIRLQAADLPAVLEREEVGWAVREALAPLAAAQRNWDPVHPPAWIGLPPELEAHALHVTRQMLFLRLSEEIPSPLFLAVLLQVGIVGLGWTDDRPERFGPGLAAWSRLVRSPVFWRRLLPDPTTLHWLATGDAPPPPGPR